MGSIIGILDRVFDSLFELVVGTVSQKFVFLSLIRVLVFIWVPANDSNMLLDRIFLSKILTITRVVINLDQPLDFKRCC